MNSSVFGSDSQPGLTLLATSRQDCSDLHSWGPGVRPVYIIHYIPVSYTHLLRIS